MRLVLPLAQHGAGNFDATFNRQQKPLTKLVASKPDFYRADIGKQWACVPKFGRSLAHQELRSRSRPQIRSLAQRGRYRCDQKANENRESYRPGPQNQQLNNQVNEGATILFGR